jgi:uncharacterized RDD family membrane protein YckC
VGADLVSPVDESFVSGDGVALDLRVARIGSRGLARLIDLVIQVIVAVVFFLVATLVTAMNGLDAAEVETIQVVTVVIVFLAYPILMLTLARGRTLGKLVLGLRVVRDDGGPVHFRHALTRELVGMAAEWPGLLPPLTWFASLWCMMASPRGKRIGDLAAGTVVIHERTPLVWGWVPVMPPYLAAWAASLDLSGVRDDLALAVRQYLVRYRFLHREAQVRLGVELTAELVARITPMPPGGIAARDFLAAVMAERHARSVRRLTAARASTALVWPELTALTTPVPPALRPVVVPVVAPAPAAARPESPPAAPHSPVPHSPVPADAAQWQRPALRPAAPVD